MSDFLKAHLTIYSQNTPQLLELDDTFNDYTHSNSNSGYYIFITVQFP